MRNKVEVPFMLFTLSTGENRIISHQDILNWVPQRFLGSTITRRMSAPQLPKPLQLVPNGFFAPAAERAVPVCYHINLTAWLQKSWVLDRMYGGHEEKRISWDHGRNKERTMKSLGTRHKWEYNPSDDTVTINSAWWSLVTCQNRPNQWRRSSPSEIQPDWGTSPLCGFALTFF